MNGCYFYVSDFIPSKEIVQSDCEEYIKEFWVKILLHGRKAFVIATQVFEAVIPGKIVQSWTHIDNPSLIGFGHTVNQQVSQIEGSKMING